MGIVWVPLTIKGVPLLGVPENPIDFDKRVDVKGKRNCRDPCARCLILDSRLSKYKSWESQQ